MPEGISQAQFFEAFQQIQDKIDAKHASMREYVGERSDKLEVIIRGHAAEDAAEFKSVMDRVLVIETERSGEKANAVKRAGLLGLTVAFLTTGFWKLLEHVWK